MCSYRVSCPAKFTNARSPPSPGLNLWKQKNYTQCLVPYATITTTTLETADCYNLAIDEITRGHFESRFSVLKMFNAWWNFFFFLILDTREDYEIYLCNIYDVRYELLRQIDNK